MTAEYQDWWKLNTKQLRVTAVEETVVTNRAYDEDTEPSK
jgi:hypothetical protein